MLSSRRNCCLLTFVVTCCEVMLFPHLHSQIFLQCLGYHLIEPAFFAMRYNQFMLFCQIVPCCQSAARKVLLQSRARVSHFHCSAACSQLSRTRVEVLRRPAAKLPQVRQASVVTFLGRRVRKSGSALVFLLLCGHARRRIPRVCQHDRRAKTTRTHDVAMERTAFKFRCLRSC